MQKRHAHVSPTLDIMAKKIFSLPEVTAAFIRDILELDVADAQIVEGSQPHSMAYEEDDLFSTAVDVRAKLHDGTEVIIEIQIRKQQYFLNRFHYYLANQLVENVQKLRQQGQTHKMYEQMEPVYGIAILEKSLLLDEEAAINKYWLTNSRSGKQLKAYYKNGKHQNLLQVAFLELDKYNKDENLTDAGRQWLEFFGNLPFTKAPSQAVAHADSLLDSSSWTKETLKWVHIAISNAKRTLLGNYHKIKRKYLQLYLNEFIYKLNRRYFGDKLFDRLVIANITGA